MRTGSLKNALVLSFCLLAMAASASAQDAAKRGSGLDQPRIIRFPAKGVLYEKQLVTKLQLTNHGGPVITNPKVVFIFWGPSFAAGGADHTYATTLQAFRNQFGTTGEFNTITQYCGSNGCIGLSNLGGGTPDWFDTSTPPIPVFDSNVQSEVNRYLSFNAFDASTIYEVFIPSSTYSDDGTGATSCGGPNLSYCAYHSWIGSGTGATKYTIQPWPGCSGCQVAGWTLVQDQEHFVCHETREAVTDPTGNAWFDSSGNEADDKCAWSPTPFCSGGYCYQYEWSNASRSCIKTR